LKKGSYFRIVSEYYPTVYGVILKPFRVIGYYSVLVYSEWCLEGEDGCICIVEPTRILTREEFEEAGARHWKTVEGEVQ